MKNTIDLTMEDLQKHHLRLDLDSIKSSGYGREFAKKYLFDRYVNLDSYLTEKMFIQILNEFYGR